MELKFRTEEGNLELMCDKCTRFQMFHGSSQLHCYVQAIRAGWVQENGKDICKRCPAVRRLLCGYSTDCQNEQHYPLRKQRKGWESDTWCKMHIEGNQAKSMTREAFRRVTR
jgi:hypothetical protein